ncbi:MAG: T9SS type A sorting domain-containing protein [Bacteroidetes bacterium]|nr:T9SS type A sorting domain-containing protein [Bacteroidota bacterium]
MKKRMFYLIVAWLAAIQAYAQPATLNASGGTYTTATAAFDWSVGEMTLVNTATAPSIIITQGILQPLESSSGVNDVSVKNKLKLYPNPASTMVHLDYDAGANQSLSYKLTDITGQLIAEKNIDLNSGNNSVQIDVSALASAAYMLTVIIKDKTATLITSSYKIQKL